MRPPRNVKIDMARRGGEPDWLLKLRQRARERSAAADGPSLKYGLGVSFDADQILWPFDIRGNTDETQAPAVSNGLGLVMTMAEALADKAIAGELRRHAEKIYSADDKLFSWHAANCERTLVIRIPEGHCPARPIRVDRVLSGALQLDKVIILAAPGSKTTVIERLLSGPGHDGEAGCRAAAVDVFAGAGAAVDHVSVQNIHEQATFFSRRRAWAGTDAAVRWVNCCFGGEFTSISTSTVLEAAGARTDIRDLFFGRGKQKYDILQEARHLASGGRSEIACRGALTDGARAVCRGLINIGRDAARCQGRQKADTLLLNEQAEVAALPSLEINNDDVSCSHASAIGRLDTEKLFYLMSRGLDRSAAAKQLVEAFFAPMIVEMKEAGLEDMVACLIGQNFQAEEIVCKKRL
jgi:Fe-S cluster assembly scaffold protein SufB